VNLPGDPSWVGRIVPVRITGANPNSLRGEAFGLFTQRPGTFDEGRMTRDHGTKGPIDAN
jgi:hypothetical protein